MTNLSQLNRSVKRISLASARDLDLPLGLARTVMLAFRGLRGLKPGQIQLAQ